MATKKTEAAAKTAAKEVKETAVKEVKPAKEEKAVKETVKKEAAKEVKKAEPVKAAEKKPAKEEKKATKAAEKKAPAKKAAKAEVKTQVFFEFAGNQVDMAKVVAAVQKKAGAKAKSVRAYVKAEDNAVYYVVDDKTTGKIDL